MPSEGCPGLLVTLQFKVLKNQPSLNNAECYFTFLFIKLCRLLHGVLLGQWGETSLIGCLHLSSWMAVEATQFCVQCLRISPGTQEEFCTTSTCHATERKPCREGKQNLMASFPPLMPPAWTYLFKPTHAMGIAPYTHPNQLCPGQ